MGETTQLLAAKKFSHTDRHMQAMWHHLPSESEWIWPNSQEIHLMERQMLLTQTAHRLWQPGIGEK